jgi:hypothetical protein
MIPNQPDIGKFVDLFIGYTRGDALLHRTLAHIPVLHQAGR